MDQEVRREARKLKREVVRLREELGKAQAARPRRPKKVIFGNERVSAATENAPTPKTGVICWNCGANDVRIVDLGRCKLEVCPACKQKRNVSHPGS